jgi:hypothetical protein
MNRTIKFRICYTAQNGQKSLIYSDDKRYLITLDGKVLENYGKDWKNPFWEEVFDADEQPIIQQYTGCHDSDNKEIYEGDIIHLKFNDESVNLVVKWDKYMGLEFHNGGWTSMVHVDTHGEVIGNIFEHKHLLEK